MKLYTILHLSLYFIFLVACSGKEEKKETVREDLIGLKKMINLDSINPVEVKWLHQTVGKGGGLGPTDYRLTITLALDEVDWTRLKKESEAAGNQNEDGNILFDKYFVKDWFPKAIKESFSMKENKYKSSAYICSPKFFTKSPFLNGYCFFTQENYVFIFLYTT